MKSAVPKDMVVTRKRYCLNPKQLELYHDQTKINVTKTYKYFGSKLRPHLDLKSQ